MLDSGTKYACFLEESIERVMTAVWRSLRVHDFLASFVHWGLKRHQYLMHSNWIGQECDCGSALHLPHVACPKTFLCTCSCSRYSTATLRVPHLYRKSRVAVPECSGKEAMEIDLPAIEAFGSQASRLWSS